ncbi:unnamed protein product, partial [Hapterophycus canaliculatus]
TPPDSSEPLNLSGSLSQSQGGYSHGMFPNQGISLSQETSSQAGHQSQSDTGGFGMSQPSPDLLAPSPSAHPATNRHERRLPLGEASVDGAGESRRYFDATEGMQGVFFQNSVSVPTSWHHSTPPRQQAHDSRRGSSFTSTKARRPQQQHLPGDGYNEKGQAARRPPPHGSSGSSGKGAPQIGGKTFTTETAAVQAFERLLSEQFRNQVMSELAGLRALVDTTREAVVDQTKGNEQASGAAQELQQELQGTHTLVRLAKESSSKVLNLLETTIPDAFQSLEARLTRSEGTIASAAKYVVATAESSEAAAREATATAAAASAAAASISEAVVALNRNRAPAVG